MKTVIPVTLKELVINGIDAYAERIKECKCNKILISITSEESFEHMEEVGNRVNEIIKAFNKEGIECGIWIHPTLDLVPFKKHINLTPLTDAPVNGKCCPLDEEYLKDVHRFVKIMAKTTGVKEIVLEDDFRMQFPSLSPTCFCENHMKLYSEYLGREVTKEEFKDNLFSKNNIYRKAWIYGIQEGLNRLAEVIRKAADEVNENINLVFSAGPSNCGADGTDMFEIIDILKGKHESVTIRLSGGPYWQEGFYLTRNMMSAVELERYTSKKCRERGIVGRAEGDVFPRPRHIVPSSHLETFHTAMIFDNNAEEILKYMLDYTSSPRYETGYTNAHIRNIPIYEKIEEMIKDTRLTGFNPVEDFLLHRYSDSMDTKPETEVFESCVRNFCTDNSLPTAHEGGGVNILFGDRAKNFDLKLLENGSIIDIVAAKALMERGVDTGIISMEDRTFSKGTEYYPDENEYVNLSKSFGVAQLELKESAEVKSRYVIGGSGVVYYTVDTRNECPTQTPSSYLYENEAGQRFLVFNFDASACSTRRASGGVFNNYCRQRLIFKSYEYLHKGKLDAYCQGHPWLYVMTRKGENSLVVGLWNFFADGIAELVINLGDVYKEAEFVNCEGSLENDKIVLTGGMDAYKFCFIRLVK